MHPFAIELYKNRDRYRDRAAAYDRMADAHKAMAAVFDAHDIQQQHNLAASNNATLADLMSETAQRYDTAAFVLDGADGDQWLIALADAAQLVWGFDSERTLAAFLLERGEVNEAEADRAASLFWEVGK
jgi:hypothetical protein